MGTSPPERLGHILWLPSRAKSVDLSPGEVERGNRLLRQSRGWMRKGSQKGAEKNGAVG